MSGEKERNFTAEIKEAARKIWLAGLGALAGAKDAGTKVFQNLVDRGAEFEKRNRPRVSRTVQDARGKVKQAWGKVGHGFDERVETVLERMGAPRREDIESLARRVERLSDSIEKLQGSGTGARKRATAKKDPAASARTKKASS